MVKVSRARLKRGPLGAGVKASMRLLASTLLLGLLATACSLASEVNSEAQMRGYLQTTNLASSGYPWTGGLADGRTKRWDIEGEGPIPLKLNGSTLAEQAISAIEDRLGMDLFDTITIADTPDVSITRGIIVSEGTATGPGGEITAATCGNVGALPGSTSYPAGFYDEDGRISTRLYVNLSSAKCTASLEVAIHEFGHALGLGRHFPGFGFIDVTGPTFWQVLFTLYSNEVGTSSADLHIELMEW
jgi:hypothetical protein